MINRENWLDVKDYLSYLTRVRQLDDKTIHRRREQLNHLLEWADSSAFNQARQIDPTFPVYLQTSRRDGQDKPLSPTTMKATCSVVRGFFEWARQEKPRKYGKISASWVESNLPARAFGTQSEVKAHEFFPLDEILRIARVEVKTLFEERAQAIICLGYLSAMRADALVTLPISCIDIHKRTINQYPSSGVRTKNHKARQTPILPLPEIFDIVKAWDDKVRSLLPEDSLWCATIDRSGENVLAEREASEGRRQILEKSLHCMCEMAGIKYRNPHQLRHGFTVYAVKKAKNLKELKAISQMLMHESVGTTDRIYAELTGDDVQAVIESMADEPGRDYNELYGVDIEGIKLLAKVLKEHPNVLDALK
jgi:site-specific recombinase XerD